MGGAVDVAVAGAGPGGLAAAIALRNAGHEVLLIEAGAALSKRWNIVDFKAAEPTMELLGWHRGLLLENQLGRYRYAPRSLAAIENTGRDIALRAGALLQADTRITGLAHRADDVVVSTTAGDVSARFVVNASGGTIGVLDDPSMKLLDTSDELRYAGGWYDLHARNHTLKADVFLPNQNGERTSLVVRGAGNQADGFVAFVDAPPDVPRESIMDLLSELPERHRFKAPLLDTTEFSIRHRIAPAARSGRILGVGEAVSRRHPLSRSGVSTAVNDGARAAHHIDQALRDPAAAERLLTAYGDETMASHARTAYDSLKASHMEDAFTDPRYRSAMEVLAAHDRAGRLTLIHQGLAAS